MSYKYPAHTYGFTTSPDDNFIVRVAKEAKPNDDFIVAAVKNVVGKEHKVFVLARIEKAPRRGIGFNSGSLLGTMNWGRKLRGTGFKVFEFDTHDPRKAANVLKDEIIRAKNFLLGRTLRVLVEAL